MNSSEEQKGPGAPGTGGTPSAGEPVGDALQPDTKPLKAADGGGVSSEPADGYPHEPEHVAPVLSSAPPVVPTAPSVTETPSSPRRTADTAADTTTRAPGSAGGGKTPPPPSGGDGGDGDEEDGEDNYMLRMSFLEHLEELRSRIIKSLLGI